MGDNINITKRTEYQIRAINSLMDNFLITHPDLTKEDLADYLVLEGTYDTTKESMPYPKIATQLNTLYKGGVLPQEIKDGVYKSKGPKTAHNDINVKHTEYQKRTKSSIIDNFFKSQPNITIRDLANYIVSTGTYDTSKKPMHYLEALIYLKQLYEGGALPKEIEDSVNNWKRNRDIDSER